MNTLQWKQYAQTSAAARELERLYGSADPARWVELLDYYENQFGPADGVRLFSAPGRAELCGNHTDHQQGCVVALAVHLDTLAAVTPRSDGVVRLHSRGKRPCRVDLNGPAPRTGSADALIYGVALWLRRQGYAVGGFDAATVSSVPTGSGLSSSAAFENLVATVFGYLYNPRPLPPLTKALAGQWAENNCFGKPCGLMDQLASCSGGVSFMDFADPQQPVITPLSWSPEADGRMLCVVKTGGSHADLTDQYAAIPAEMRAVAQALGVPVLSAADKRQVEQNLPALRAQCGDRAVLRALNYFDEIDRTRALADALARGDSEAVPAILTASGNGSQCWLQNVSNSKDPSFDGVGLALYLSKSVCPGGAFRVHGGGFGGTVLALVPAGDYAPWRQAMEQAFGPGCCTPLRVRRQGGVEITPNV